MNNSKHPEISALALWHRLEWGQRVGAFTRLPALIRQLGTEPVTMLARAGITCEAIADPENRVPYQALVTLLCEAAQKTACPHIGLLLGRTWHLGDVGMVGEAVRHSPSVGRALQTLIIHHRANSDGGLLFLTDRGSSVDLGYAIYHPAVVGANPLYDVVLAAAMNFMRELCGRGWVPSDVFLPYAKPDDIAHHRSLFKVLPHFSAGFCALRFPVQQLSMPVVGADLRRGRAAMQSLLTPKNSDLLSDVYRAVRRLLIEHRHGGDEIAEALSMHRRTLNRRLQAQGTSFQHVLDDVRFQVARELLASDIALDDIAAMLGYSTVTPFMRTFRRWSGTTPGRWRGMVRGESSAPLQPFARPYSASSTRTSHPASRSTHQIH